MKTMFFSVVLCSHILCTEPDFSRQKITSNFVVIKKSGKEKKGALRNLSGSDKKSILFVLGGHLDS